MAPDIYVDNNLVSYVNMSQLTYLSPVVLA